MSGQSRSGTNVPVSTHFNPSADQDPSNPARRNALQRADTRESLQFSGQQVATPASSSGFVTPHCNSNPRYRVPPPSASASARVAAASTAEPVPPSATTSEFWDWENSIDFTDVAEFYEPQGELAQAQYQPAGQDFSFPHAISVSDASISASSPQLTPGTANSPLPDAQSANNPFPLLAFGFLPLPAPGPVSASAMKRKDRSESASVGSSAAAPFGYESMQEPAAKRTATSRSSSVAEESPTVTQGASFINPPVESPDAFGNAQRGTPVASAAQPAMQSTPAGPANVSTGTHPVATRPRKIAELATKYSAILPAGKVFPIQIGNELFRLSGASISSDGKPDTILTPFAMNRY